MVPRIPSSLKWLIDKRARLDAEIKRTRDSLAAAKGLLEELSALEGDLAAIDRSLKLHEIQVDVENIRPIRSHYVRINLPRGELTRSILLCLRLHEGRPVLMTDIAAFVEARHADLNVTPGTRERFHRSIHDRLKNLCREGVVQRNHLPDSNKVGLWSIATLLGDTT